MLPDDQPPPGKDRDPSTFQSRQAGAARAVTLPGPARAAGPVPLRVRYLALGLLMGGIWAWNGSTPLWVHAVKLVGLMAIVTMLVRLVRQRRAARAGIRAKPQLSVPRVLAVKASLVLAAMIVSWLLDGRVSHAYLVVATGLLVVVALLGPRLHPRLLAERPARGTG
jgi:hypothetical protein